MTDNHGSIQTSGSHRKKDRNQDGGLPRSNRGLSTIDGSHDKGLQEQMRAKIKTDLEEMKATEMESN